MEGNGYMCFNLRYGLLEGGADGRNWGCVLQLALFLVTVWGRRREIFMCAAFSVMVCYRVVEMRRNGNVFCS